MTSEQTSRPSDSDQIKLYGLISGIKSDEVVDYNYSYYANGVNWTLVDIDISTSHGDSGGTIVESSDKGDLYGIVTTHDWWGILPYSI